MAIQKKHNVAPFLHKNKDICVSIQQYAHEHLNELSVELILEYIHDTVLPQMMMDTTGKMKDDREEYEKALKHLLNHYGLTCICLSTVYKWMQQLGFCYKGQEKGYYMDGHKKPTTIK